MMRDAGMQIWGWDGGTGVEPVTKPDVESEKWKETLASDPWVRLVDEASSTEVEVRIEAHRILLVATENGPEGEPSPFAKASGDKSAPYGASRPWTSVLHGVGEVPLAAAVQGYLLRNYRLLVDLAGVREAVGRIGATVPGSAAHWGEVSGVDPVTGESRREILSSSEVFRAIRPLVGHAAGFVASTLAGTAGPAGGEIRLAGPAAAWPGLARALAHDLGRPVREARTAPVRRRRAG